MKVPTDKDTAERRLLCRKRFRKIRVDIEHMQSCKREIVILAPFYILIKPLHGFLVEGLVMILIEHRN